MNRVAALFLAKLFLVDWADFSASWVSPSSVSFYLFVVKFLV